MNNMNTHELVSALADGELSGEALAQALDALAGDQAAAEAWQRYHLIGDVLRSGEGACTAPAAFVARLSQRLATEPAPRAATPVPARLPLRAEAANDPAFRWKLVAGAASVAAVVAVAWGLVAAVGPQTSSLQLARSAPEGGVMIRDPQLDELLAAHRQLGSSALQMPAAFVRQVTFDGPDAR